MFARSPIPTAHRSRLLSSTSSTRTRLERAKNPRCSWRDRRQKSRFVPAIRSQCRSEFRASRSQEVRWLCNLHVFTLTRSSLFVSVQWYKGAREITNAGRTIKEVFNDYVRFSVKESKENDSGIYFIVARNKHGVDRAFCQLTVRFHFSGESRTSSNDTAQFTLTRTKGINATIWITNSPSLISPCITPFRHLPFPFRGSGRKSY